MAVDIRTHTESLSHKSKTELASFAQTRVSTAVNMVLNPIRYTVNKEDTVTSVSSILGISPSVLQQNLLL